jgi:hypothetical protein
VTIELLSGMLSNVYIEPATYRCKDEYSSTRNFRAQPRVLVATSAKNLALEPNPRLTIGIWSWGCRPDDEPDTPVFIRKDRLYGASGRTLAHCFAHQAILAPQRTFARLPRLAWIQGKLMMGAAGFEPATSRV